MLQHTKQRSRTAQSGISCNFALQRASEYSATLLMQFSTLHHDPIRSSTIQHNRSHGYGLQLALEPGSRTTEPHSGSRQRQRVYQLGKDRGKRLTITSALLRTPDYAGMQLLRNSTRPSPPRRHRVVNLRTSSLLHPVSTSPPIDALQHAPAISTTVQHAEARPKYA